MSEEREKTAAASPMRGDEDTLPKLLLRNYRMWGKRRIALRKKRHGIWNIYTWADCYQNVEEIFYGLQVIGLGSDDKVAILGDNGVVWFWSQLAIQSAGGRVIGLNPALSAAALKPYLEVSRPKLVLARDQEQVDKLLEIEKDIPYVQKILYWDEKGLRHYQNPRLLSLSEAIKKGHDGRGTRPGTLEEHISRTKADATALIMYRSEKEGTPEEVPATHRFLISAAETIIAQNPVGSNHEYVSLVYPGWLFEQVLGYCISLITGQRLNFAEGVETAFSDFREISPHSMTYPAHLWESLAAAIEMNMARSSKMEQALFRRCLSLNRKLHEGGTARKLSIREGILALVLEFILLRCLRDKHGLNRIRVAYSAGGSPKKETVEFLQALGVNLKVIKGFVDSGITLSEPNGAG